MILLAKPDALARVERERGAGCAMCDAARDQEPIASSEHAIAVLDRFACRPGHVLVILRRHVEKLAELPWLEYAALQRLAYDVAGALDRVLAPRRIYVAALGSAVPLATSFPHVHLHVIPLVDGGEVDRPANVLTWANGMYVFEDGEEAAWRERLRGALRVERA
jgi:diadenosine tetraphosphate (Ap4A) HIT family hydrolase